MDETCRWRLGAKPGDGQALLDHAKCPPARLAGQPQGTLDANNLKGTWSEDCFTRAFAG